MPQSIQESTASQCSLLGFLKILRRTVFLFFSFFPPLGFIMTVSRPCYFGNLLLGVVGVDVNLAYILEDVTYYQDSLASYTFLIDNKGMDTDVVVGFSHFAAIWDQHPYPTSFNETTLVFTMLYLHLMLTQISFN